jgi:hypothetical protein
MRSRAPSRSLSIGQHASVVQWLLEDNNPSIKYLTLTKLLDVSPRRKDAVQTRNEIPEWEPVRRILANQKSDGGWDSGRIWYLPKYKSTIWQLLILSQTGIDPSIPAIGKMCDYVLRFQMPSGGFQSGTVENAEDDWARLAGCLNGNVIAALCRLGWARDSRIWKAAFYLASFQEQDGGWGCRSFGYHSRDKHSCFMGAICALEGLVEYSKHARRKNVDQTISRACEFLLMHRLYKADHHRWKIMSDDYTKLQAPWLVGYNVLRGLRVLTRAGITSDERMKDALELLAAKRNSRGRWIRETAWPSTTYSAFGRVGAEDKWVTLNALLVLKSIKTRDMKR